MPTDTERAKLMRRLAYMRHGPGRPPQHASDEAKAKWKREVEQLRDRMRRAS